MAKSDMARASAHHDISERHQRTNDVDAGDYGKAAAVRPRVRSAFGELRSHGALHGERGLCPKIEIRNSLFGPRPTSVLWVGGYSSLPATGSLGSPGEDAEVLQ